MNIPDLCAGSADNVAFGQTVTLSGIQTKGCLGIHGTVIVSGDLSVNTILVYSDGFLDVQSGASIAFRGTPINTNVDPRKWGQGLIVIGRVRMLGGEKTPFRRVTTAMLAGQTSVTVSPAPTGWSVGDELFIPDTRQVPYDNAFDQNYALRHERRTIAAINGGTITLTSALTFDHLGAVDADGSANSSYLPHVANLSRSITIRSAEPGGVRGHTVYTDRANVEIRNVSFRDLGRTTVDAVEDADGATNQIGRYPLHIHMLRGPVNPGNTGYQFTVTGNVVRDTLKWPIAIHGSHYGLIENNVVIGGIQNSGAGIALEDGSETENLIRGNFVGDVRGYNNSRWSGSDTPTPGTGAECIWAAGFNNRFVNNVVTGCRNAYQQVVAGVGFKFFVPAATNTTVTLNPSVRGAAANEMVTVVAQNQPILEFDGNEAYGLMADGLTIWHLGLNGYEWNQSQAETVIKDLKVWNTWEAGIWLYPTNHVTIQNFQYRHNETVTPFCQTAITGGDYRQVNLKVSGGNIHACTITSELLDPVDTFTVENVTATTKEYAVSLFTPATPGTTAIRPAMGVSVAVNNLVLSPWPGLTIKTLSLVHRPDYQWAWVTQPYIVHVTEGLSTFRVCFGVQQTQNLYGGTCTAGTPRSDINGLISGTAPPSPPDPPDPPDPPSPDPPTEVCGNGIDDDHDGSIDEGCPVVPPTPPVDNPPSNPFVFPPIQVIGADVSVSGVETTWNTTSETAFRFPFDPLQATHGMTAAFTNTPSGTYAIAFRIDATKLAALGQDSNIGILSFRPEPDINIHTYPVHGLAVYRGDPAQPPLLRAFEGHENGTVVYAMSSQMTTFGSTTTAIVTWTPTNFTLYVNGVLADTRSRPAPSAPQVRLMVAAVPSLIHAFDQQYLRGVTRTPAVYDRVLSSNEIATLHAALALGTPDPDPPEPPPTPNDPPTVTVSPTSVSWSFVRGSALPAPVIFGVTTTQGAAWSTSETSNIFSLSAQCAAPSTCETGTTTTLSPTASFFSTATVGVHTGQVRFVAPGAIDKIVTVAVTVSNPSPTEPTPPNQPPNPDLCVSDPLRITQITWPAQRSGRRAGSWNSGTKTLLTVGFAWSPSLRLVATDVRGCTVTVVR